MNIDVNANIVYRIEYFPFVNAGSTGWLLQKYITRAELLMLNTVLEIRLFLDAANYKIEN